MLNAITSMNWLSITKTFWYPAKILVLFTTRGGSADMVITVYEGIIYGTENYA